MTLEEIQAQLQSMLKAHCPPLQIRFDTDKKFEAAGTKERMQGKQKVDGFYFGSVIPKPKDIRLYFFPLYTHPTAFDEFSAELQKCLKGKTCFHIKKMDDNLKAEITAMIKQGVELYIKDDLI